MIEIELTKIRRMAEQVDNDHLVYFIDMAISEIETKLDYRNDNNRKFAKAILTSGARKSH